jgi:hypothetical protein
MYLQYFNNKKIKYIKTNPSACVISIVYIEAFENMWFLEKKVSLWIAGLL